MDFKGSAFNGVQGQSPWPCFLMHHPPAADPSHARPSALKRRRLGGQARLMGPWRMRTRAIRAISRRIEPIQRARGVGGWRGVECRAGFGLGGAGCGLGGSGLIGLSAPRSIDASIGASIDASGCGSMGIGWGGVRGGLAGPASHSALHCAQRTRAGSFAARAGGNSYCAAQSGQVIRMSDRMTFSLPACNRCAVRLPCTVRRGMEAGHDALHPCRADLSPCRAGWRR
jgi:hypothetical protein